MFFAELMAFSAVSQFWVEISGTFLAVLHVVVGPLQYSWGSESDAKEFLVAFAGGGGPARATREDDIHPGKRVRLTAP